MKSSEYPTKARRPKFSALSIEKIKRYGIKMRHWKNALRAYLIEKGYIKH
ncbi:sugar nucleotide-binding protein [Pyrococcus sp. NA2]|nr:sugar nucleotide-binding protein [Pyrococcus sp. NA2]